jgi:hypothetical protein
VSDNPDSRSVTLQSNLGYPSDVLECGSDEIDGGHVGKRWSIRMELPVSVQSQQRMHRDTPSERRTHMCKVTPLSLRSCTLSEVERISCALESRTRTFHTGSDAFVGCCCAGLEEEDEDGELRLRRERRADTCWSRRLGSFEDERDMAEQCSRTEMLMQVDVDVGSSCRSSLRNRMVARSHFTSIAMQLHPSRIQQHS